jgi:hypothetical protein
MAVLHTWTQQLVYHPHVHCLVTDGGVSDDGRDWHPARGNFLVPTRPLAVLVRAKMRAALAKTPTRSRPVQSGLEEAWVIHCTARQGWVLTRPQSPVQITALGIIALPHSQERHARQP